MYHRFLRVGTKGRRLLSSTAAQGLLKRVGVVGAGPSGFYAAKYLLKELGDDSRLDMFEKLPTPFGLVRAGVAPDHPEVKSVQKDFESVAQDPRFRFLGNVCIGRDVSIEQLREHYDVLIMAYGASEDRVLNIPGEGLKGVMGARTFVNWYNGHPDFAADAQLTSLLSERLSARAEGAQVVVLGQGNVALDCARVLAKDPSDLASTDICEHALGVLRAAPRVAQVSVVGRRGHVQAAFTIKELRELTRIAGAATVADPAELQMAMTPASAEELEQARPRKRLTELIQSLPSTAGPDAKTSVALRFLLLPKAILPDPRAPGMVGAIVLERARLEGPPGKQVAVDTGEQLKVPCQLVLRSIGYRSLPIPGLPFDKRRSVVRNEKGRVLTDDNTQLPGVYCTGWVKRGPTGIINTNIIDARETVAAITEDCATGRVTPAAKRDEDVLQTMVQAGKHDVVSWEAYQRVDEWEQKQGAAKGKPREKVILTDEMLKIARG